MKSHFNDYYQASENYFPLNEQILYLLSNSMSIDIVIFLMKSYCSIVTHIYDHIVNALLVEN